MIAQDTLGFAANNVNELQYPDSIIVYTHTHTHTVTQFVMDSCRSNRTYLSSFVQVDETSSEIVWVTITDERQVFEEHTDIGNTWCGCVAKTLSVHLIVTLWIGLHSHMTDMGHTHITLKFNHPLHFSYLGIK